METKNKSPGREKKEKKRKNGKENRKKQRNGKEKNEIRPLRLLFF
jgi:hypothetical protein